jgi:hypothetical protein
VLNRVVLAGVLLVLCSVDAGAGVPALKDQFGDPGGLDSQPAGVQVAIVVTAKRLRRIKPWEQALREVNKSVPLLRVADIPRNSPAEFETVAAKLRKRLPEDVTVLIDLDGVWARQFDLDVLVPNLLIFDPHGMLVATHSGMYKRARFEAFIADLNLALAQPP